MQKRAIIRNFQAHVSKSGNNNLENTLHRRTTRHMLSEYRCSHQKSYQSKAYACRGNSISYSPANIFLNPDYNGPWCNHTEDDTYELKKFLLLLMSKLCSLLNWSAPNGSNADLTPPHPTAVRYNATKKIRFWVPSDKRHDELMSHETEVEGINAATVMSTMPCNEHWHPVRKICKIVHHLNGQVIQNSLQKWKWKVNKKQQVSSKRLILQVGTW